MILTSNKNCNASNSLITFGDSSLTFNDTCTFLGVVVDPKLNFSSHINQVTTKIAKSTGILYRIRANLSREARIQYYYAFLYPFFSYNIIAWGSTFSKYVNPLFCQQKRCIRLIANADFRSHTDPLFRDLKILKLHDIFKYSVCVYMYRAIGMGLFPAQHNVSTRNQFLPRPSLHRLSLSQHHITFTGPKLWNELPLELRNINSLFSFKKKLKLYYLSQYA